MSAEHPEDRAREISTQVHSQKVGAARRAISIPVNPVTTTVKIIEPLARRIRSRIPGKLWHQRHGVEQGRGGRQSRTNLENPSGPTKVSLRATGLGAPAGKPLRRPRMSKESKRLFTAGQVIFQEGQEEDIAYIIEEGEVEIWTTIGGDKKILNRLHPGALFGELALVDRQPRSASATALKDTVVTVVTQQQVDERLADADPILRMVLLVVMRHFRSEVERSRDQYGPYRRKAEPAASETQRRLDDAIQMIKTEAELRAAMKNDEFKLLYQPIYHLGTQEIMGVEALIRWKSPSRGDILPGAFMPLAESTSLIVPIGNWVIETGLKDFLAMQEASSRDISISFNLARRQMEHKAFLPFLSERVASHGLDPARVKLEMLERNLFKSDQVQSWIQDCQQRGFGIHLDDFGTGYSSLQYLQEYQPAALKIDRSFVSGLGVRPESQRICKAIIDLADALGIGAIAEGVETRQEAGLLLSMGCQYAQGFLFSPPVSAEEIAHKMAG